MRSPHRILLVPTVAVLVAACAQGGTLVGGFGGYAGAGGEGGEGTRTDTSSSSSGTASGSSSGATSSSSTSSSTSTSSSSSTSSTSGATCDFDAPVGCPNATQLQSIAGDENHDVRTASGETSAWFNVLVEEAVSSLIDYPSLSYTVTLASPASTSYGLFVYTGGSSPTCFGAAKQGTGSPATVHDSWGDSIGIDDSTWITIEVRYLSGGACGPSDQWTLTVAGHT